MGWRNANGTSHSSAGFGPIICGRGRLTLAAAVAARRAGVDVDHHVAQTGIDRGGSVLEVNLEAGATGHRAVGEAGMDAEVLGEQHRRHRVAHAVDVVEREAGVGERSFHHRDLERASVQIELSGRRSDVGDADERSGTAHAHWLTSARSAATSS